MHANYPESLLNYVMTQSEGLKLEGFMPSTMVDGATLMLVGEAPGQTEIEQGLPFTGRAGENLFEQLTRIGHDRTNTFIVPAVKSRPYAIRRRARGITYPNRTPNQKEIDAHAVLLDWEIALQKPTCIVPIGNIGLQRLLGKAYKVGDYHGQIIQSPILNYDTHAQGYVESEAVYTIIPTFHPAATLYNPKLKTTVIEDWNKIKAYLQNDKTSKKD